VTLLLQVIALTGVLLSVMDFFFQKRSTRNDLKMTKQEVRQESKNNDGDPLIKGRRRQLQAELSRNRTLATVADSTVVIVNPVHFAVALKYEAGEGVPVVTARAAEGKAVEIRDEALAAGVPVIECVPLARHLHKKTRRGFPIPAESYAAVAVALAFVSKLGNKKGLPVVHRLGAETVGMSNDGSDIYTGDSPALQPTS
jgi:flagellar biosynthetic protein FlhB